MNILEEIKQFVLGVFYHTPEELLNDVEIDDKIKWSNSFL